MAPGSCSGVSPVSLAPVALVTAGSDLADLPAVSVSAACEAGDLLVTMEPATRAVGVPSEVLVPADSGSSARPVVLVRESSELRPSPITVAGSSVRGNGHPGRKFVPPMLRLRGGGPGAKDGSLGGRGCLRGRTAGGRIPSLSRVSGASTSHPGSLAARLLRDFRTPSSEPTYFDLGAQYQAELRTLAADLVRDCSKLVPSKLVDHFTWCYNTRLQNDQQFHILDQAYGEKLHNDVPRMRVRYLRSILTRCGTASHIVLPLNHAIAINSIHWSFVVMDLDNRVITHYDSLPSYSFGTEPEYVLHPALCSWESVSTASCRPDAVAARWLLGVQPPPPPGCWWLEPVLAICYHLRPATNSQTYRVCKPAVYLRQPDDTSCGLYMILGIILATSRAVWTSQVAVTFPDGSGLDETFLTGRNLRGVGRRHICSSILLHNAWPEASGDGPASLPPGRPLLTCSPDDDLVVIIDPGPERGAAPSAALPPESSDTEEDEQIPRWVYIRPRIHAYDVVRLQLPTCVNGEHVTTTVQPYGSINVDCRGFRWPCWLSREVQGSYDFLNRVSTSVVLSAEAQSRGLSQLSLDSDDLLLSEWAKGLDQRLDEQFPYREGRPSPLILPYTGSPSQALSCVPGTCEPPSPPQPSGLLRAAGPGNGPVAPAQCMYHIAGLCKFGAKCRLSHSSGACPVPATTSTAPLPLAVKQGTASVAKAPLPRRRSPSLSSSAVLTPLSPATVHERFFSVAPALPPKEYKISKKVRALAAAAIELLDPASLSVGAVFPPPRQLEALKALMANWYVRPSLVCEGQGLFSSRRYAAKEVIGIYAGKAAAPSDISNAYSMRLGRASLDIDGTPDPRLQWTWAGYLNDDRTKRSTNCRIWRDGSITATKVIPAHTELIIDYGAYYDWRTVDLGRFRRCLAFVQACLPVGSEDWHHQLSSLGELPPAVLESAWPGDFSLMSREAFTLWYTCAVGLEDRPQLLHSFYPSRHSGDTLLDWLARFCACKPIAHLLSWKADWGGEMRLDPERLRPPDPLPSRAGGLPARSGTHLSLLPGWSLRPLPEGGYLPPWGDLSKGIVEWALHPVGFPPSSAVPSPLLGSSVAADAHGASSGASPEDAGAGTPASFIELGSLITSVVVPIRRTLESFWLPSSRCSSDIPVGRPSSPSPVRSLLTGDSVDASPTLWQQSPVTTPPAAESSLGMLYTSPLVERGSPAAYSPLSENASGSVGQRSPAPSTVSSHSSPMGVSGRDSEHPDDILTAATPRTHTPNRRGDTFIGASEDLPPPYLPPTRTHPPPEGGSPVTLLTPLATPPEWAPFDKAAKALAMAGRSPRPAGAPRVPWQPFIWRHWDSLYPAPDKPRHCFQTACWNVAGVSEVKMELVLWYMCRQHIDVFALVDTRSVAAATRKYEALVKARLGDGAGLHCIPTPAATAVGGQILILSPRAAQLRRNSWFESTRSGALQANVFQVGSAYVAIFSSYWPQYNPSGSDALYSRIKAGLPATDACPYKHMMESIDARTQAWSEMYPNLHPMLLGDINLQLQNPPETKQVAILREVREWLDITWLRIGSKAVSRPASNSTPDHALIRAWQRERWSSSVGSASFFHDHSDHLPILTSFQIEGRMLPRKQVVRRQPRPDLNLQREEDCIIFADRLEAWVEAQQPDLLTSPSVVQASESLRKLSEESADTVWQIQQPRVLRARRMAKKRFDFWTPELALLQARSRLFLKSRRDVKLFFRDYFARKAAAFSTASWLPDPPAGGGPVLCGILAARLAQFAQATAKLTDVDEYVKLLVQRCPFDPVALSGIPPEEVLLDLAISRRALDRLQLKNNRKRFYGNLSAACAQREKAFQERKLKRVIQSVMGAKGSQVDLTALRDAKGHLCTKPEEVHSLATDHFDTDWFNVPVKNPFGRFEVDFANSQAHRTEFMEKVASAGIPPRLGTLIWRSIHSTSQVEQDGSSFRLRVAEQLATAVATPPSLEEFIYQIRQAPSNSAGGATGLSYNQMKKWGPQTLNWAHHNLVTLWTERHTPDWWKDRFLVPIGKGETEIETNLANVRPLMLLEVLRKLWTGIFNHRFRLIREKEALLNDSQHGFRHNRGTVDALLQLHNLVEQVQENSDSMLFSTWDIKRAFDSIEKWVIELSVLRAGCTPEHAQWLAAMDVGERTFVRTPYLIGLSRKKLMALLQKNPSLAFSASKGTPQGDVVSPDIWTMFFDILLTALEMGAKEEYGFTDINGETFTTRDTAFADDLQSASRSLEGLQQKADIVSAFCIIFGLQLMPKKLRAFRMDWTSLQRPEEEKLLVHLSGWIPNDIVIRREGHSRYLGVDIDPDFNFNAEFQRLENRLHHCLAVLRRKSASVGLKTMVFTLQTLAQARYGATLAAFTPAQLKRLDKAVSAFYRRLYGYLPGHPAALLYTRDASAGHNLPMLSEQIIKGKMRILARVQAPSTVAALHGMMSRIARLTYRSSIPGDSWAILPGDMGAHKLESWLSSLLDRLHLTGRVLARQGIDHSLLNRPLLDPLGAVSAERTRDATILERYGLTCLGDVLHVSGSREHSRLHFELLTFDTNASTLDRSHLRRIRAIGRAALCRDAELLKLLPPSAYDLLKTDGQRMRFLTRSTYRPQDLANWTCPLPVAVRPGQCWISFNRRLEPPTFDGSAIYEILGLRTDPDGGQEYWCRKWTRVGSTRKYMVSEDEAGGAVSPSQIIPCSALFCNRSIGLQAFLSRDSTRHAANRTSRRISRKLLDHGLRCCGISPLPAAPLLRDITELTTFIGKVAFLAEDGEYILCTDGGRDEKFTPSQAFFRDSGKITAGAAIVALPLKGALGASLPALHMDDNLEAMDSAFPLEYLALTIAKYVAHMVPGCKHIYCDCESVIMTHGHLPRISPYAPLDLVWPDMGLAVNLPKPEHVHSHLEDILPGGDLTPGERFDKLSRGAKGNVLADWAAYGRREIFNVVLDLSSLLVEDLLACTASRTAGWMRLRTDSPRLCHNFHSQEELHRDKLTRDYWLERTLVTASGYIWVHGRSRLAAAAGLVGSKAIAGKVGTIKLIHDKYWWGNRHNPLRAPCAYCSAHPPVLSATAPAYVPPLTGIEHWGSDCADPAVVRIRKDSETDARNLLQEKLAAHPQHLKCALFVLGCMVTQPYRFQGRFDLKSSGIIGSELDIQQGPVSELIRALTDCVRIFLEAGKDIYALRTPGQTLARARQKANHKLAQAERHRQSSASLATKAAAKLQRQLAGEAARLAAEQATAAAVLAEAHERAVQPWILDYFTPPSAAASCPHPRLSAAPGASRLGKPPRPPSRVGGKRRQPGVQQGARPTSGGIIDFLSELRPPSQHSLQGMEVEPLTAVSTPFSQDGLANQEALYVHYTRGYSHPSHAALLERYRHHMGDYLKAMLERYCYRHMVDHANAEVTVPLAAPFGEVGFKKVPCLSGLGVLWGDVLHFLGYTFAHWLNLTQAVIDHCRPTLHVLPMSARMDAIPYEEYCAANATRNSSHTTKRLRARTTRDSPVRDGNYFAEIPDRVSSADDPHASPPPHRLKDAEGDASPAVRPVTGGMKLPSASLHPPAPSISSGRPSLEGGAKAAGARLSLVPKRVSMKRPDTPPFSIACYFQVVEPPGLTARVPLAGGAADPSREALDRPAPTPLTTLTRAWPCRPSPLSAAARALLPALNPQGPSAPQAGQVPSGNLLARALESNAKAPRQSAFKCPPKARAASPPLITNFFRVIEPQGRSVAPPCESDHPQVISTLPPDRSPEDLLKSPPPGPGTSRPT